jgi:hypothetical protein
MRVGLTVSIAGHAAILAFGLIAFPDARPFAPDEIEALPVELVDIAEVTDLLAGDRRSEKLPEEAPQPTPQIEAEIPIPEPAEEEPAEQPVEAARESAPPPPPPEPESEPEPEVAALPQPQETAPPAAPEPEAPIEPNLPRARPDPPRPVVAEPTPAPETPQPTPSVAQQEPRPEFNPDDIAALLNKQQPAGGGVPLPSVEPQTIGSIEGQAEAAMTQSEIAALKARLYQCWNPPIGVREAGALIVEVRISLLQDGSLAAAPMILSVENASNPLAHIAAEAAVRAVVQCAPFGDILRPEKYALWNQIDFVFDPREMLGG